MYRLLFEAPIRSWTKWTIILMLSVVIAEYGIFDRVSEDKDPQAKGNLEIHTVSVILP